MFLHLKWEHIKWCYIHSIEIPEGEERENEAEEILDEVTAWEFSKIHDRHQTTNPRSSETSSRKQTKTSHLGISFSNSWKWKMKKKSWWQPEKTGMLPFLGKAGASQRGVRKYIPAFQGPCRSAIQIKKKKSLGVTSPNFSNLFCSHLKTFSKVSSDRQVSQSTETCLIGSNPGIQLPSHKHTLSLPT